MDPLTMYYRWLWGSVAFLAIWASVGFALAFTVAPGAINMALGAGVGAAVFVALATLTLKWYDHKEGN